MNVCHGFSFPDLETNKALVVKETAYTNNHIGITEPQRKIIKALVSGKGNYLIEVTRHNGRKMYRCYDRHKNIVGNNFSKVVVKNLVSKEYLISVKDKLYLK
jgi:hypothetical protein